MKKQNKINSIDLTEKYRPSRNLNGTKKEWLEVGAPRAMKGMQLQLTRKALVAFPKKVKLFIKKTEVINVTTDHGAIGSRDPLCRTIAARRSIICTATYRDRRG